MSETPTIPDMPSDEALYAEIDAEGENVLAIPSANTIVGDAAFRDKVLNAPRTLSTLAPEDREVVRERLNAFPPILWPIKEPELVQEFIAEKVRAIRVRQGPGPNANALTQARWEIAREADDLDRQQDAIIDELAIVDRYNPETGAPIYRYPLDSQERRAKEAELHRLNTVATNLRSGKEGQERLVAAREQALADAKRRIVDAYIAAEAPKRAEAQEIERRVNERAAAIGKRLKGSSF